MWCVKCNKNLGDCTCPDLLDRLRGLKKCKNLIIDDKKIIKQVIKNKTKGQNSDAN